MRSLIFCGLFSVVFAVAGYFLFRRSMRTLPTDYFVREDKKGSLVVSVIRNVLGIAVIGVGIVLLFLPGQGVLTVFLGVFMLDAKLRRALMVRMLQRKKIAFLLADQRAKAGQPPFDMPATGEKEAKKAREKRLEAIAKRDRELHSA